MKHTTHGIDLTAPGGIQDLLDFHRTTFGDAQMNANGGEGGEGGTGGDAGTGTQGGEAGTQGTNGGQGGQASTTGTGGSQTGTQGGTGDDDKSGNKGGDPWDDPTAAKAEIERLRQENNRSRVNAKETAADEARNSLVQDLGKALGLVEDKDGKGGKLTPEQLTTQLQERDTAVQTATTAQRDAQVHLAVVTAALDKGGDHAALLDSKNFLAKLDGLDPAKDAEKITKAVEAEVRDNPRFRAARAASRSSAEFNGGSGEQRTQATGGLAGAVSRHYGV